MTTEAVKTPETDNDEPVSTDKPLAKVSFAQGELQLKKIDEGNNKGAQFWSKRYKNLQGAIDHFTELSKGGKKGEDVVLGLINSALEFRLRAKTTASLTPSNKLSKEDREKFLAEKKAKLSDPELCVIISQDDAQAYVPGERDVSAISGLMRQKNELLKAAKAAKDAGNKDEAKMQILKYHEVCKQIEELQAKEAADLLAELGELSDTPTPA